MAKTIELHLTSDSKLLSVMRAAVKRVGELAGFNHAETSKIVLAVDEACSNIIRHAYENKGGQSIVIICRIKQHKLEFILLDEGKSVKAENIKSRSLNEHRPGGLGVYLIKTVMDKVKYENGKDMGNRLYMYKRRPKRKDCESKDRK